jgi:MoxR-like ATPase
MIDEHISESEPLGPRYWKISPGENAWQWEECRRGNFIGVGWELFGDIGGMTREEFDARYNEIMRSIPELRSDPGWTPRSIEQLWTFASIQQGDVVVANRGTREVLGTGRVAGAYYFVPGQRNGHRFPVVWRDTPRTVAEEGWRRLLLRLDEESFEGLHAEPPTPAEALGARGAEPASAVAASAVAASAVAEERSGYRVDRSRLPIVPRIHHPSYGIDECARDTGIAAETLGRWVRAIERKGQAIIYGPPGTGKTYVAEHLARHIAGGGDGLVQLVQLHPAYAYEDFVLGIRPRTRADGTLEYPLVPGRFLRFCEEARACTGVSVLILDEINRADLARVFGELMYLLEYRDAEVPLAGGIQFSIPGNVRIIGTMNTADRSIAVVDHALRRRFAFIALGPSYDLLLRFHAGSGFAADRLVELLARVNREINDAHYELGISYFLRDDIEEQIEDIWRMEIEPYLEEYFFDQPAKAAMFRWDVVKELLER